MLVIADASVLVVALKRRNDEGDELRRWLVELSKGERLHVVQSLTHLEVTSALRRLAKAGKVPDAEAEAAIMRFTELPALRHEVTQPMARRIWELRHNLTVYDASYVALTERLEAEELRPAMLATADARLANCPGLSVQIELFALRDR